MNVSDSVHLVVLFLSRSRHVDLVVGIFMELQKTFNRIVSWDVRVGIYYEQHYSHY